MATRSLNVKKLKSPFVLLVVAAILAGGVAWTAYYYLQQREAAMKAELAAEGQQQAIPKVEVVVPRIDAAPGTVIDGKLFVARAVEEDLIYPDTILAADFEKYEGRQLARPLLHGRALRVSDMLAPQVRDVSSILPVGRRALTIDIDSLNSIAQTLRPNNHVDVFLISKSGNGQDESEQASLFMQNMQVLATGTDFHDLSQEAGEEKMVRPGDLQGRDKGYDSVTLLVTPAEAARLLVGQKLGSFRVVLRGHTDDQNVQLAAVRGRDLMPAARGRDTGVEFIVGGRGERMVSELPVLPSQQAMMRTWQAQFAPKPATESGQAAKPPATSANSPVPALQ